MVADLEVVAFTFTSQPPLMTTLFGTLAAITFAKFEVFRWLDILKNKGEELGTWVASKVSRVLPWCVIFLANV